MSDAPKKYVKINGIMKLNPVWKKWKEQQAGAPPATTVADPSQALPVVTNMEDHEALSGASVAAGGPEIALSESTNATIEMMQEPEIAVQAGMTGDDMVDELGTILNKYEVPMGLMNKLMMLSEYDVLEFLIDDSGSMTLNSDTTDKITGKPQTRWQECHKCVSILFVNLLVQQKQLLKTRLEPVVVVFVSCRHGPFVLFFCLFGAFLHACFVPSTLLCPMQQASEGND